MKKSDKIILGIDIVIGFTMIIIGIVMNVDAYQKRLKEQQIELNE